MAKAKKETASKKIKDEELEEEDEELLEEDDDDLEEEDEELLEEDDDEDESDDEDDDDDDDSDDEDEDDEEDEDDDDDDDDDEEDEKPVKKSSKKAPAKKEEAKKSSKKSKKDLYQANFEKVLEKVANHDNAKKNPPPPTSISNELFYNLVATKDNGAGLKKFFANVAKRAKLDDDIIEEVNRMDFTAKDGEAITNQVLSALFDVLQAGSGIRLFNNDICKAMIKGSMTDERILDNSRLNVSKERSFTKIDSYLRVSVKSAAPKGKKHIGMMNGKKFVEWKEEPKKSSKKEATKKTSKKEEPKKASKKAPAKKGKKK